MLQPAPLSLAMAGLDDVRDSSAGAPADSPGGAHDVRAIVAYARVLGVQALQLDAAAPGLRARELDRSARRDLASLLRRSELAVSGLDLWIPPDHFTDPRHVDRALAAAFAAMELARDLAQLVGGLSPPGGIVAVTLPRAPAPAVQALLVELRSRADQIGCVLADCAWPPVEFPDPGPVRVGLDPAAVFAAGADPHVEAARLGPRLAQARLSDLASAGRVAPGSGRLKLMDYAAALLAAGAGLSGGSGRSGGPVVLDLRSVSRQNLAAPAAVQAWQSALAGPATHNS